MVEKSKKGKKRWIKIVGPSEFKNAVLGESYVLDPESLIGKKVELSLGNLIRDMKKQNYLIGFKINEIKGAEAHADIVSYEMMKAQTKRLVRSGQDKVDDSFIVESKDKKKIKIKPMVMTRGKAHNSSLSAIRLNSRERIKKLYSESTFKEMLGDIVSNKLQRILKQELRKIYPIAIFEIRKVEIVNK